MFANIEAVIFDLDGTLIDSMWIWEQIDIEYLGRFNYELPRNLHDDIEGLSFTETAQYFKKRFNIEHSIEQMKKDWSDMARDYYENKIELKDNAKKFIDLLYNNGIKLGIGTSNSTELTTAVLDRLKIRNYFDFICTACDVKRGKPHPDIYLKAAQGLHVSPSNCLAFEDVPNGIIAAKRAGMKTCGIYDDLSKHLKYKIMELADLYIYNFNDIIKDIEDETNGKRIFAN